MNKIAISWVFVLLQAVMALPAIAETASMAPPALLFEKDSLVIATKTGKRIIQIEVAATPEQKERGLMHRTSLAKDSGMLFVWPRDEDISMWMKDTIIPLDMLFIDKNGIIVYIAPYTKPESLDAISAGVPVRAVLELPAGAAKEKHIEVGDKVITKQLVP